MSDDEYEFEYSDEDQSNEDDITVSIQNEFYAAKGKLGHDDDGALEGFATVIRLVAGADNSADLQEWHFKALKNIVKTKIRKGPGNGMLEDYAQLLDAINAGAVTRNRAEKAINSILELVSAAGFETLEPFYNTTLEALQRSAGNDRLVFKTRIKLAKLYLSQGDWKRLRALLSSLSSALSAPSESASGANSSNSANNSEDRSAATQLLEVYALEIQMYTCLGDSKRLADAHRRAVRVSKAAVPHPAITGIIFECGAKSKMAGREWEEARVQFMEAFKAYEEAGATEKTLQALKYMLLGNMLSSSKLNPFDSQETKAYQHDPSITGMTELTNAFLAKDIKGFEAALRKCAASLEADEFMRPYVKDLVTSMRTQSDEGYYGECMQVLLAEVVPYTRLRLSSLSSSLGIPPAELEALLVSLILDKRLDASIDQVAGVLKLHSKAAPPTTSIPVEATPMIATTAASKYEEIDVLAAKILAATKALPKVSTMN